ncbi:MAG: YczE/YyaS/YitT family protein [Anaerocolumna sp.]
MSKIKEIIKNLFYKERIIRKTIAVLIAVVTMGFALSLLVRVNMGTDPCTSFNLGVAELLGLSLGNWQVIFNCILLLFVIRFDYTMIGLGTLANMILVGYSLDFFSWIWNLVLSQDAFSSMAVRIVVLFPTLILFIFAAAVYMAVDMGTAPYDALPFIIANAQHKIPFRVVRIIWDVTAATIGYLLGSTVGVITVIMALALGPVITLVQKRIRI